MAKTSVSYNGKFIKFGWESIGTGTPELDAVGLVNELRRRFKAESRREAEIVKRAFERTTATWSQEKYKVEFKIKQEMSGDVIMFTVSTENEIYGYVNNGTIVRKVVMTPDYIPKTHVRVIGSGSGQGSSAYYYPEGIRPGIEAREFDLEIAERREPWHQKHMSDIFTHVVDMYWRRAHGS